MVEELTKDEIEPYNFRMPKRLKKVLERQAREDKRSLNQYMVIQLEKLADVGDTQPATV
jgi:predicted HicB family RNase H-like nuclease